MNYLLVGHELCAREDLIGSAPITVSAIVQAFYNSN